MNVHLIDGTYELFRHYFALPSSEDELGNEVGAVRGVLRSVLSMLQSGATHVGVATDHTVESFRNDLYDGYKTGEGMEPELWEQFGPLEDGLRAMGVVVWPMIEVEADDGLASAARIAAADPAVHRVFICTPDKDLGQSVVGDRVVQFDRRRRTIRDAEGIREAFGVYPSSIPDYLALVGDTADGFPGLPGWGAKSTATVLARYETLEAIPKDEREWDVKVRGAARLGQALRDHFEDALLFRTLARLRSDVDLFGSVDELRWAGPRPEFKAYCDRLRDPDMAQRASKLGEALAQSGQA